MVVIDCQTWRASNGHPESEHQRTSTTTPYSESSPFNVGVSLKRLMFGLHAN
ncbi:hypothetical protein M378DRAFT_162409 [Amanita muscaria Koide BX008]|uniref:Uncharacterized protein n=1 Tax=Amanita muscaria (strain Koide BX008) TaxID=946122 RepID=A0A0C2X8R0_AMAMK|nr:hypothetical protein M378DRAFT_162409 [Amanita muscaria Koide BX008]